MTYIYGILEVAAILSIYCLFSLDYFEDKENLRLVGRVKSILSYYLQIGKNKNRINKLYTFKLPKKMRQEKGKLTIEESINRTASRLYSKEYERSKTMKKNLQALR